MTAHQFHPEAEIDLDEIWEYIAVENVNAADRMTAAIHQALDNLVVFPNQGHRRTDLTSRPLRFIYVRDYLIVYAPDEKPLWVVASCMATATRASCCDPERPGTGARLSSVNQQFFVAQPENRDGCSCNPVR